MKTPMIAVVFAGALLMSMPAGTALADHDHYLLTPNGKCHQVARGQTAIGDSDHGGFHRYHVNVHVGATESTTFVDNLGDGHAPTAVYKDGPAPSVCDGS